MTPELCEYEIKVLRDLNGEKPKGLQYGAAYNAALEYLRSRDLVNKRVNSVAITYAISNAGRAYLAQLGVA